MKALAAVIPVGYACPGSLLFEPGGLERAIHPDKRGKIPDDAPPILIRLGIAPDELIHRLSKKRRGFYHVVGKASIIRGALNELGASFLKGISAANRLFPQLK